MPASYGTRFGIARKDIEKSFADQSTHVYTLAELGKILEANRAFWRLGHIPLGQFLKLLTQHFDFHAVKLDFPHRPVTRYVWGKVTDFEIIQSINEAGYFSHYTAIRLHDLTLQIPKVVYFNTEQSVRPGSGTLSQEAITRTFRSGKWRTSSNIAPFNDISVCQISGGNTDNLGVAEMVTQPGASSIRVTNVERTLIDAAVRPIYSGGVFEVKKAFAAAKDKVSVNKLSSYLKTIDYTYPVHQSIGFYMQQTGYRPNQIKLLEQFPREYDFYLDYGLKQPEYDKKWRLFFPKGL
jgi:predicted transcriptional regulator of viral defense system